MSNIQRVSISPHFTNYECLCKCNDPDCDFGGHTHVFKSGAKKGRGQSEMHPKILTGLEKLRALACEAAGEECPLQLVSAARCGNHNRKIGGHPNSQHLRCAAVDVRSRNPKVSTARLAHLACQVEEFANGGIGVNEGTVHVDVGHKAFWFYTEKAEAAFKAPPGQEPLDAEEPAEPIIPPDPPAEDPQPPEDPELEPETTPASKPPKAKPPKKSGGRRSRK